MSNDKNVRIAAIIKLVAFSVTLVILVAIFATTMTGGFHFDWNLKGFTKFDTTIYNDANYLVGDQTYSQSIKNIDVDWVDGSITLEICEGDSVMLKETGADSNGEKMRSLVVGDTLYIKYARSSANIWSIPTSKNLTVSIPRSLAAVLGDIDISSASATVKIHGWEGENALSIDSLSVDTASGNVTATGIVCGEASVSGASAKIDISGNVGRLDVSLVSGDLKIVGSVDEVDLEAVSGNINLISDTVPSELNVETVSGSINITVPDTASGFVADLDTVSGNMSCNNARWLRSYKHGNGVAKFDFETVSGDVYIMIED